MTEEFQAALSNTVAAVVGVISSAVSLSDIKLAWNEAYYNAIDIHYTARIYTTATTAALQSTLDQSVSNGTFSLILSRMYDGTGLIVQHGVVPLTRQQISPRAGKRPFRFQQILTRSQLYGRAEISHAIIVSTAYIASPRLSSSM